MLLEAKFSMAFWHPDIAKKMYNYKQIIQITSNILLAKTLVFKCIFVNSEFQIVQIVNKQTGSLINQKGLRRKLSVRERYVRFLNNGPTEYFSVL